MDRRWLSSCLCAAARQRSARPLPSLQAQGGRSRHDSCKGSAQDACCPGRCSAVAEHGSCGAGTTLHLCTAVLPCFNAGLHNAQVIKHSAILPTAQSSSGCSVVLWLHEQRRLRHQVELLQALHQAICSRQRGSRASLLANDKHRSAEQTTPTYVAFNLSLPARLATCRQRTARAQTMYNTMHAAGRAPEASTLQRRRAARVPPRARRRRRQGGAAAGGTHRRRTRGGGRCWPAST